MIQLARQRLGWEKVQGEAVRAGVQKDAPEQSVGVIADVEMVQPVPVIFHLPDELAVGGELFGEAFLRGAANRDRPQIVRDQMEEISHAEGEVRRITSIYINQVAAIELQIGEIFVYAIRALEMRHFRRRAEFLPFLIRDAGVGGDATNGEGGSLQAGNLFEQDFSQT